MVLRSEVTKSEAAKRLLHRRRARVNLLDFTTYTKHNYDVNWHHRVICQKVDELLEGKFKNLMISCPARNGKSEIVSRRLPAYVLGKNPDARIIACSYSSDLASSLNRDVQKIIETEEYAAVFPETRLNSSNMRKVAQGSFLRNSDVFEIVGHEGVYRSAGVGGGITGLGFNEAGIGIIDDPIKNREEAESETIRNKIWDWYESTFYTRREGNAPMLLTCTRWHEDDLAGRLLRKAKEDPKADQWEVITLPALSEDTRAEYDVRKAVNLPLWPEKYSLETLEKIKATVSAYTWLSMFQQRPAAAQGLIFRRENFLYFDDEGPVFKLYKDGDIKQVYRRDCVIFQTCDPAGTTKTKSDFFVLATWAFTKEGDLLLIDVFKTRIEGPDHVKFIKNQYNLYKPLCIGFESVGIGKTTYQKLERLGFNVVDLQPDKDKYTRAMSAAVRVGERRVYFKRFAHWLNDFEEELLHFPTVKHDDQTDNLSYADYMIGERIVTNFTLDEGELEELEFEEDSLYSGCTLEDIGVSW